MESLRFWLTQRLENDLRGAIAVRLLELISTRALKAAIRRVCRARRWEIVAALAALSLPAAGLELQLADLHGTNGFVINGVNAGDNSGISVSGAGDVNGGHIDDLLIGASRASPNGLGSGASYVVFGRAGVGSSGRVELSALDGTNGFVLKGVAASGFAGAPVSAAGDVNGDGIDDLLISATGVDTNGSGSGASYVVFGSVGPGSGGVLELSALDGAGGFVLNGVAANYFTGAR